GRTNGYYEVDPVSTQKETLAFKDCETAAPAVKDDTRAQLNQRPWAEQLPYDAVASDANPCRAFKLRVVGAHADAALFAKERKPVPLGVAFHNAADGVRRAYAELVWPPARPRTAVEARTKVWVPNEKQENLGPGEFSDLRTLLRATKPDDVILIKYT